MYKRMIVVVVVCFALGIAIVWAQVDDKMGELHNEVSQKQKVIRARALLQNARSTMLETNVQLQEIADTGSFDKVNKEIKQALLTGWNVVKGANQGFEDPNLAKLLDWSPND